jgi:Fe-S-cluster-containing dehydrogenase component
MNDFELMMKCDMCYDRTSAGKKPMCATVCPSGALFFGTRQEIEERRPRSAAINRFQFGSQDITTKVNMMVPRGPGQAQYLDVAAALNEQSSGKSIGLDVLSVVHSNGEVKHDRA